MAPRVPYNPLPSVMPSVGASLGYQHIEATPEEFGAQVGQATQRLGGALEQAGGAAGQIAIKQQGMINETLATNAETQYMTKLGAIMGQYKSKEGLAAASALPQTTADIQKLRGDIEATLPNPAAQKAFRTLALRHEGYALQDANTYSAAQIKAADAQSAHATIINGITRAGDAAVAANDDRFNDALADIQFGTLRHMSATGWDEGTGMAQDPKTGKVTFDESTQNGKNAKAVYQASLDEATGKAWEARLHVLADQNVNAAYSLYQKNRNRIPGEAQVKLDAYFTPKLRDAQTRTSADGILADVEDRYRANLTGAAPKANTINDAIFSQESGNSNVVPISRDGAVGPAQIKPSTFTQYAKPGEDINNPADNRAVGNRIIEDLKRRYPNDPARVAVGYFSGPGNVSPPGSPNPWINDTKDANGKSVSSYVGDIQNRLGAPAGIGSRGKMYQSRADFYRTNYADIVADARAKAENEHPDDPRYADTVVSKVEQRLSAVIKQQDLSTRADAHLVGVAINGSMTNGKTPTSAEELRAISPEVKAAYDRIQTDDPLAAAHVETILTKNAKAGDHDLKTYGPKIMDALRRVHLPEGDGDRIDGPQQLLELAAKGDITLAGKTYLEKELKERNEGPHGVSITDIKQGQRLYAESRLTFDNPITKEKDKRGREIYNQKFLPAFEKAIDDGIAQGKTIYQLLSPKSPDYITDKIIDSMARTPAQVKADRVAEAREFSNPGASLPQPVTAPVPGAAKAPSVGEIQQGYRFKGGDPSKMENWENVGPQVPVR